VRHDIRKAETVYGGKLPYGAIPVAAAGLARVNLQHLAIDDKIQGLPGLRIS